MNMKKIIKDSEKYLIPTYRRIEKSFVTGKGVYLFDDKGKKYLDFLGGIAVSQLGYAHPKLVRTLKNSADKVWHTSNFFYIPSQTKLAEEIAHHSFDGKTFFCNSGTEANEGAYKLALKYGASISTAKKEVVSFEGAFHGRTLGSLTLTANPAYRSDFPAAGIVYRVPFGDIDALEKAVNENTAAVFLEAVQGESGVRPCENAFYRAVRSITKKYKALMIVDEVQTGIGRTGKMFGYQNYSSAPDIITIAKGLGGGVPIGAVHASRKYADYLTPGTHASTFGGGALATTLALEVVKEVGKPSFLSSVKKNGEYLRSLLTNLSKKHPEIIDIRGYGLMNAFEMKNISAPLLRDKAFEASLIVNAIGENIIRMVPPLIVKRGEVKEAVKIIDEAINQIKGKK